jgi:hypothetical protein
MRKFTPLTLLSMLITISFAIVLTQNACKGKGGKTVNLDTVQVNPNFEMKPPIAGEITLTPVKDNAAGNILFAADFGTQLSNTRFHAVMSGDQKIVLRDDGKGGDEKEGDGKFSVILKQDMDELAQQIQFSGSKLREGRQLTTFNGRTMVRLPIDSLRLEEKFTRFRAGEILRIPRLFPVVCGTPITVIKDRSLMVTAPAVVEDPTRTFNPCTNTGNPNGAWSFPRLITEMANTASTGVQPKDFLMNWLQSWQTNQTVNGETIASRDITQIINTWSTMSGGTFDIKFAPFKLVAIVNRVDLRGNSAYSVGNAGEGRFVFCALTCNGGTQGVLRNPAPFMVIFEYGVPKKTFCSLKTYAKQWADLSALVPGTAGYNTALEALTNQFALANTNPDKPNGNSLNQLRTNEFALGGTVWELREFIIDATTHMLKNVTTKREPQIRFNQVNDARVSADVETLAAYINAHTPDVEANKHEVPDVEAGKNFQAGKAETVNPNDYHWNGIAGPGPAPGFINSDSARFVFSLNTCSGCHGGDANTGNFMHVAPGFGTGVPAILSGFLRGGSAGLTDDPFLVFDRANRPAGRIREFNDLKRRKEDLESFVLCTCARRSPIFDLITILRFDPLRATH